MEKEHDPLRHTASHLLAAAVKNIFPKTRLGVSHDTGTEYAYDFDFASPIKQEDLEKIEAEMMRIIKLKPKMIMEEKTHIEARKILTSFGEPYKMELLSEIPKKDKVKFYKLDTFTDMCAGPHIEYLSAIKAIKLTKITGAYWRADATNKMLTRIYGVAFKTKAELEEYNLQQEEIKKRDHNKIGRDLGYFATVDVIGQGLPLLMPKGAKVVQIMQRFVEDEQERRGYQLTITPRFAKKSLYEISGHWSMYKDGMYVMGNELLDADIFALRPMTCPFQFYIYKNSLKSYRELPVRYCETANLFRKEKSGEMHGLIRVAEFTLSDGHVICRANQVDQAFNDVLDQIQYFMDVLKLSGDVSYRLSKGDPKNTKKYVNNPKAWKETEDTLRKILTRRKMKFVEADDDAAYYGPKIDIQYKNVYGKEDTIITAQLDFALAERFDMTYTDEKGEKARPYIVHHSGMGCYERTLAMLIEKYAGAMPVWLSPSQAVVMGITDNHLDYVDRVYRELNAAGVRIEKDVRNEKVGYKIREHTMAKVPYLLVVGDKEIEANKVAVRTREGQDLGSMPLDEFVKLVQDKCKTFD